MTAVNALRFGLPWSRHGAAGFGHTEYVTGELMGSLRCYCRDPLEAALQRIAAEPCGVVLSVRHEGRGISLTNKARADALQGAGMDRRSQPRPGVGRKQMEPATVPHSASAQRDSGRSPKTTGRCSTSRQTSSTLATTATEPQAAEPPCPSASRA